MDDLLNVIDELRTSHLILADGLAQLENIMKTKTRKGAVKKEASFEIHYLSQTMTEKLNNQHELYRKLGEYSKNLKFK